MRRQWKTTIEYSDDADIRHGKAVVWIFFSESKRDKKETMNILALQYLDSGKLSTDVSDTDTGIDWLIYPAQYSQQCQAQSHFVVRSRLDIVENTEIMVGLNQAFYCGTLRPDCRSFRAGIFRQKNISSELLESFGEQITRGGRYIHNGWTENICHLDTV